MPLAMKLCDLGVASEGSFGSHPSIFIASADDEFLIFIDTKKLGNNSPRTEYGNQF
jgi:hypothetical protein